MCLELGLPNSDNVVPALRKMKQVISMVPKLEAFYKQVCNFVLVHNPSGPPFGEEEGKGHADGASETTARRGRVPVGERVLPILQHWVQELRTLAAHRVCVHPCRPLLFLFSVCFCLFLCERVASHAGPCDMECGRGVLCVGFGVSCGVV